MVLRELLPGKVTTDREKQIGTGFIDENSMVEKYWGKQHKWNKNFEER